MPIYEFMCTNAACNNIEEHLLRHSDPLPDSCEKCASPLEKIVSQTSFALKGSGWYVTDYKGSSAGSSSAPSTNSDTKTEAKTESTSSAADSGAGCGAPACGTSACASAE